MINDKYKGIDPISFRVAAFLLAGTDDRKDPAIREQLNNLINAADSGELDYIPYKKKIPGRRIRHPGVGNWVRDGVLAESRGFTKAKVVTDWWESKVYRKDVYELYKKTDVNFICKGISPDITEDSDKSVSENTQDNLVKEDNKPFIAKRTNQKINTQERNIKIQERMEQLAQEKKDNGDDFTKDSLAYEISKSDEFKEMKKDTISRITKKTWKKK